MAKFHSLLPVALNDVVLILSLSFVCTCYVELNKLASKLDGRIKSSAKSGGFKSKQRLLCSPSTLLPPCNASKWAITEEYLQDATPSGRDTHDFTPLDVTP